MQVTIYTTTTCPFCKMLKDYLEKNNVSFEEKMVDQDDAAREEMMQKSEGYLGVPFTSIKKDNGEEEYVLGFDRSKFDGILGLAQGQ